MTLTVSILAILALGNYILTNLKAIGFIVTATTGGAIPFSQGIIVLSLIMVIYETLGGMRSVAWTDMVQGVLLILDVFLIFFYHSWSLWWSGKCGRIIEKNSA